MMITAFLLGFGGNRIKNIYDINISWLCILLIILLVLIVIEVVADIIIWRYGELEEVEEK